MGALTAIGPVLSALGPSLQPFLASGGSVLLVVLVIWLVQRNRPKVSAEDLAAEQWDYTKMEKLRQENDQLRAERRALEHDRDRGWDLARAWNRIAHMLFHQVMNAIGCIPVALRHHAPSPPTTLPGLEELEGVSAYAIPERYVLPSSPEAGNPEATPAP